MTSFTLLAIAVTILPIFGLAAWGWLAMASESDDLLSFPLAPVAY